MEARPLLFPQPTDHFTDRIPYQQRYQKDAIIRQMKEYKREKGLLESQVTDLTKRSLYHDDHLRIIDIWFTQVGLVRTKKRARLLS